MAHQSDTAEGSTLIADDDGGIVGFYAEHTASKDFQTEKFGIEYRFPSARSYTDAIGFFGEVQAQAGEQAKVQLAQVLAERAAQAAAVSPAGQPVSVNKPQVGPSSGPPVAPHPASSGVEPSIDDLVAEQLGGQPVGSAGSLGGQLQAGTTPKGKQIRFLPTSVLASRAFEDAIKTQIGQHGFDPGEFVVFDNRGTRDGSPYKGLEDGGQSYSVATVRAKKDTPLQAALGEKTAAFYVDFQDDGTVKVKPSDKLVQADQARKAFAGGGA